MSLYLPFGSGHRITPNSLSKLVILPSVQLCLVFQFIQSAVKADAIVAADYCPTLGALPSLLFLFKKLPDAIFLDAFKVLNHAHSERSSVAFVDMTEPVAWKILAFIAVLYLAAQKQIAALFEEGALLVSWPATFAVRHSNSLALYIMFQSKVSTAYSTVHSARSN